MSETQTDDQCRPGELWYPGLHLDEEFPVPTNEELVDLWQEYNSDTPAHALQGVYGVYSEPKEVRAVASIDLCEVVRETSASLDKAVGLELGRRVSYDGGTWFDKVEKGLNYEQSVVVNVIRAIMSQGLVEKVEFASGIAAIVRNWRARGIYCVANTSTLPGCEESTIKQTLARDYPGCFDALVLPRNHEGTGHITKAIALDILANEATLPLRNNPFVHIDDAPHHVVGFQKHYANTDRLRLFMPELPDAQYADTELVCETPLEAFLQADRFFRDEGVIAR